MPVTQDFTIQIHAAAFRAHYAEARRHVVIPLHFTADDTWLLEPTTVGWWERSDGLREPITIMERNVVIARVLAVARERHHLRIHTPDEIAPLPNAEELSPPDGEDTLVDDLETAELNRVLDGGPTPDAARVYARADGEAGDLLGQIDTALARIEPMAAQGWDEAMSIARQLRWCRGALLGEIVENPPGPFSMGLIATREFDMYGSDPELAALVNAIERAMNERVR